MSTNFTIESWNSLSTEWQKIFGINLIANFRLSPAQLEKIFQFGQNPFDCYKATFGKQFKNNVIEEEISLLPQLETLFLADLNLNEIPLVEQLSQLKNLDICCNNFTNLNFLANCKSLEILLAEENKITDISALKQLNNLTQLNLRENKLKNIDALENHVQLNYLDVGKNQINELSTLRNMNLLTELQVDVNLISSCGPLVGLTNLSVLVLAHNPISDLEKLNSMKSLHYLDIQGIEGAEIVDFSALKTLPDFEFLK